MSPRMTVRSRQWYTNTTRLPNSLAKVSIGRLPLFLSEQRDHRRDGRWEPNVKYVWVDLAESLDIGNIHELVRALV
jgi:hypothetical protein